MPVFFFHLRDDLDVEDQDGVDLPNADAARARAIKESRLLMCETLNNEGRITLHHRIDIEDGQGNVLDSVYFRDAVTVED